MQTQTTGHDIKLKSAGEVTIGDLNNVRMTIEDRTSGSYGVKVDGTIYPNGGSHDLGLSGIKWNNVYANNLHGDGSNITNIGVPIVKHVRQTSNYEISTGNTSWGVAGSMQMSITAPSNNCLLFYAYNLSFSPGGSGGGEGNSYRGRVFVNGTHSHNFIGQVQGGSMNTNLSATFQNEGYSGSTYYSANDTITVQVEIRNLDSGSGNKTRLNSGSYLTVLAFATS